VEESRYIPKGVSDAVKERDFFECAWCGTKLTERHHIVQYSEGGENTLENLILLCSNCHTQIHRGEINVEELKKRKSNHLKGDRLSGNLQFELKDPHVQLGGATFKRVPILIQYKQQPLLTLWQYNKDFFLNASFYDCKGDLIFWMSSNRFWSHSKFDVIMKKTDLRIINTEDGKNYLHIWQNNDYVCVEGINYLDSKPLIFSPTSLIHGPLRISNSSAEDCLIGFWVR